MGDLKVADSEYSSIATSVKEIGSLSNDHIKRYNDILTRISENAVKGGNLYFNLINFTENVRKLEDQINEVTELLKKQAESYIEKIDEKDEYLY
ncbi:hypothetical protein HB900_14575 [Listeria booriae]|uniref:hypothetical protein n=1 Tax=Listeria booriae TaxID=1552123 RepID=UPI00162894AF|nr:hypothetical protein [Listeria booriae]MBC1575693.1 hypothetical protein [Listeria booriae]MBC2068785.1 hypothetical protein [Listeria booriae]